MPNTPDFGAVNRTYVENVINVLINHLKEIGVSAAEVERFRRVAKEVDARMTEGCEVCLKKFEAAITSSDESAAPGAEKKYVRKKFLLRLIISKFRQKIHTNSSFPYVTKSTTHGLDSYLMRALGNIVYDNLNQRAKVLIELAHGIPDEDLWQFIQETPVGSAFVEEFLARFVLRFSRFERQKTTLISVMNNAMRMQGQNFDNKDFTAMFIVLFDGLFNHLQDENEAVKIDYALGDGISKQIHRIREQFIASSGKEHPHLVRRMASNTPGKQKSRRSNPPLPCSA